MSDGTRNDSLFRLLFAWGFVGVPLAWGVYQTAMKVITLFK